MIYAESVLLLWVGTIVWSPPKGRLDMGRQLGYIARVFIIGILAESFHSFLTTFDLCRKPRVLKDRWGLLTLVWLVHIARLSNTQLSLALDSILASVVSISESYSTLSGASQDDFQVMAAIHNLIEFTSDDPAFVATMSSILLVALLVLWHSWGSYLVEWLHHVDRALQKMCLLFSWHVLKSTHGLCRHV